MISSVADHYANHLAPIYSWMVGDLEAACTNADQFYTDIGLPDGNAKLAVDLGCGHGVHSIPFARRGYRVIAIDNCRLLLEELKSVVGDLQIETILADLTLFGDYLSSETPALIACMGDTLTHLPSIEAVDSLIHESAGRLDPEGLLAFSFRDYSRELKGTDRFIPVRSDENRIHTCFLEYRADQVLVHDIIQTRDDSLWQTTVSAYSKLRLVPDTLIDMAVSKGLSLTHRSSSHGMINLVFGHRETATGR